MIGIGIDYAIQFHNRIDEELIKGKSPVEAAISTVNHVALPVIIALIVTEAGFVALLSSTVPMINDFGKVCIIGLVMCYLSALFVGVTVLCLSERKVPRKKKAENQSDSSAIGTFIEKVANICVERWKAVLAVALILALAGNYADTLVPIETNMKNYIPQDLTPLIDLNHMKAIFGGTDSIQFLVQADDVTDPKNLKWMDDFSNYLLTSREDRTESVTSIATYVKEANGGEIPDDKTRIREIIASLPKAVQDAYLSGHNLAVLDVNVGDAQTNLGTEGMARLIKSYEDDLAWITPPPGVSVRATGQLVLMATVIDALDIRQSGDVAVGPGFDLHPALSDIQRPHQGPSAGAAHDGSDRLDGWGHVSGRTQVHSPHCHLGCSGSGSRIGVCHTHDGALL